MADHAVSNSVHATRRHGAHDSGLDVDAKDDTLSQRLRDLEEENSVLAEKATSACTLIGSAWMSVFAKTAENLSPLVLKVLFYNANSAM